MEDVKVVNCNIRVIEEFTSMNGFGQVADPMTIGGDAYDWTSGKV